MLRLEILITLIQKLKIVYLRKMGETNTMTLTPTDISQNYFELMEQQESLTPEELQRRIQNEERSERAHRRAKRFELIDNYKDEDEVDEGVVDLFYGSNERKIEIKSLDSSDEENDRKKLPPPPPPYSEIESSYEKEDIPDWPDDWDCDDGDWGDVRDIDDWTNVFVDDDIEEKKNPLSKSIIKYFTRRQSDWDKLCRKLDIDQRFFKLHSTKANGNCLFESLSFAYVELAEITDDKIGYLRSMIAQTMLDPNNEEATNVLKTWHMLYNMFKKEGDKEMIRHYNHMECLDDVPEEELLTDENRRKVYNAMMEKDFWGEEYSLKVFERELKAKFIILNADKQKIETTNNKFDSKELVLLYYSHNHYQIISYQERFVFDIMNDDLGEIEDMLLENNINIYEVEPEAETKKVEDKDTTEVKELKEFFAAGAEEKKEKEREESVEEDIELIFDPLLT